MKPLGWRRAAAGILAALVLGGGGWAAFNLTFPARRESVVGQPYLLHVQAGVPPEDVREVVNDLELADTFFRSSLGRTTTGTVHVKFARFSPCLPFVPLDRSPTALAQRGEFCLNMVGGGWPYVRSRPAIALSIVAHEHFHNLQAELGCLPGPREHEYAWWVEGSATPLMPWLSAQWGGSYSWAVAPVPCCTFAN